MTLIVEDGTGVTGANSYVTMDECSDYCSARGLTFVTSPSDPGQRALVRATAAIDAKYRYRFPGYRTFSRAQELEWPRTEAYDYDYNLIGSGDIPQELKNACCEAAVRELATPGSMAPDLERGGDIKSIKAGSVAIDYGSNAPNATVFTIIDGVIATILGRDVSILTGSAGRS